jgi:hypothetical protein
MYDELWCKGGRYGRYINFYVYIRLWRYVALSDAILHFGFFLMCERVAVLETHVGMLALLPRGNESSDFATLQADVGCGCSLELIHVCWLILA